MKMDASATDRPSSIVKTGPILPTRVPSWRQAMTAIDRILINPLIIVRRRRILPFVSMTRPQQLPCKQAMSHAKAGSIIDMPESAP